MLFRSLAVLALVVASTSPAAAQDLAGRFAFRGEGAVAVMLPDYQQSTLGLGAGAQGALRVGVRLFDPVSLQVGFASTIFPGDHGTGQLYTWGGGVRVEPMLGDVGRLFFDAHASVALTGDLVRFALDGGVGFEFQIIPAVAFGPVIRYGHVFAADGDFRSDASFLTFGASLAIRIAEEPPRDRDGDGVLDTADLCVNEPEGATPDPNRPGCPARDTDADGVLDQDDHCATTPAGSDPDPSRPGCPTGDADGDGFADHDDACPDRVPGLTPDPARPGCPAPDRDADTVADPVDACPDEAGAPHPDPARHGCPSLVRVEGGQIRILRPVFFATNRDVILARSREVLQAVADALAASPGIRRLSIEGHTDDVGEDGSNLDLSERRALNVMAWLVTEGGVEPQRLEGHGFGESRPLIEATTDQARSANRRVEFRIVDPPQERSTGGE